MKKKTTVFVLAAALTLGLSGCGNSNTTETEAETVTEAVTEAPETEAETAEETEEVTEAVTEAETETESETEEVTEAETESETEEVTEAETETEEITEAVTEEETEAETDAQTEAESESETDEVTEAVTEAETETETEEVTEAVTEAETETETEEVTEAETETETEEVTEAETETETEEVTEAETETETEEVTEAVTEAETETETEEVTEAVTEAETEIETEEVTEAVTESESEASEPEVMTYEEYIAADVDTLVVVETYVQAKQSWWDDTATVYTQDEDGAYFLYNMECSEEDYELLDVGTKIQVTGYKSEWSGEVEIIDATFEIVDDGDTYIAEALDVTELLGTDELEEHQNEYVSFTGMTVEASEDPDGNEVAFLYAWDGSGSEGDDLYFNVSYNGETYNFVIESYLCDSTTEVYQAVTELSVGDVIDMEGFLYWYEGVNPHITSVVVTEAAAEEETEAESETEEVTEEVTESETEEPTEAETETEEVTEAVTEAETEEETEEPTEAETETEEVTEAVTEAETEEETEEPTEAESETEEVTEAVTETETEEETEEPTEAETETEEVTEAETDEEAEVMTYEEYIAADVDTLVVVETYVQAKQSWWEDTATVYTQDEDGAYFLYNMECSEEDYELLEVGTKIKVTGYKSEWSGEVEIIDATFEIIDDGDTFIAETLDVTELLGTDELEEHQNEFVSFTGMTVEASEDPDGNEVAFLYAWDGSGEEGDDLYFNVSYNGETYTFVVESYLCDSTTEVYQAVTELEVGDVIDMEGFLYWYEGVNPHITSVAESGAEEVESESETE